MRVLAVSDEVVGSLYSQAVQDRFREVDLILGCGDLPSGYLEYLVTELNVPLLYVPGNHDPDDIAVPGGESIDGRIVERGGLRFAGLGGCLRYKPEGRHQYTENEMRFRTAALLPSILLWRILRGRGFDVLVTHAPPRGIHEGPDRVHRGFVAFRNLVRSARPRLMVHGHSHIHANVDESQTMLDGTRVVNVFPYRNLEIGA
ncbi:MAG: metallophosphoesterase [Anaerolineales bacterium]